MVLIMHTAYVLPTKSYFYFSFIFVTYSNGYNYVNRYFDKDFFSSNHDIRKMIEILEKHKNIFLFDLLQQNFTTIKLMVTLFIITFFTQTFSNTYQDSKSFATEILSSTFEYFIEKVAK